MERHLLMMNLFLNVATSIGHVHLAGSATTSSSSPDLQDFSSAATAAVDSNAPVDLVNATSQLIPDYTTQTVLDPEPVLSLPSLQTSSTTTAPAIGNKTTTTSSQVLSLQYDFTSSSSLSLSSLSSYGGTNSSRRSQSPSTNSSSYGTSSNSTIKRGRNSTGGSSSSSGGDGGGGSGGSGGRGGRSKSTDYASYITVPTLSVVGLAGNIFVVVVVAAAKDLRRLSVTYLMLALAVSDAVVCVLYPFQNTSFRRMLGYDIRSVSTLACKIFSWSFRFFRSGTRF